MVLNMPTCMRGRALWVALLVVLLALAGAAAFVGSGIYNVAADVPHTQPTYALLEMLRERSIAQHAKGLEPPDLTDPARIRQGSGNYDAMCVGCHLAPGMPESELSKGLYPTPPALAKTDIGDPARAFWVIKHGIKSTGMPAWGKSMEDEYIWGLVAFLRELPKLDAASYRALVASSGGHSHDGGETLEHENVEAPSKAERPSSNAANVHEHADGSSHVHPPKTQSASQASDHKPGPRPNRDGSPQSALPRPGSRKDRSAADRFF